ncbi:hypothetical protein [Actinomyces sp.]|uniref:VG15 protein n=1 Tax=Actinomyces sp. TaxID=29317 RepID=UPI00290D8634|nr:hypothetical protein [Actinomyces sp.]MDU7239808.1 hypothetical protein [Actinomyces sp.]
MEGLFADAITQKHVRDQAKLARLADAVVAESWSMLDPANLSASEAVWLDRLAARVQRLQQASSQLAEEYYQTYRANIVGAPLPKTQIPLQTLDFERLRASLHVEGVVKTKKAIGRGIDTTQAMRLALKRVRGATGLVTRDAGRGLIVDMAYNDKAAGRWRRVCLNPSPCAFCAMIAGRGPVYSEETSQFEAHAFCGCQPEPTFKAWEPNEKEAQWRAAYIEAAETADDAGETRIAPSRRVKNQERDHILYRMRRQNHAMFSDGVTPKT